MNSTASASLLLERYKQSKKYLRHNQLKASRRRRVANLVIGSVLLGVLLGCFFQIWVLGAACAVMFSIVLTGSAYYDHSLMGALLESATLTICLQIGYVTGLFTYLVPGSWRRRVKLRGSSRPAAISKVAVWHHHVSESRLSPDRK